MGYDMSVEQDQTYFRLNIFGMSEYRDAMEECGMVFWPAEGNERWPRRIDFATDEQFREAAEEYRDRDCGGVIPGHKLCSNDGWLVTESECRNAVEAWEDYTDDGGTLIQVEGDDYWDEWINYLRYASTHGGFRVW